MKPPFILIILAMVATLSSCKKENIELASDPEVEEYIADDQNLLHAREHNPSGALNSHENKEECRSKHRFSVFF